MSARLRLGLIGAGHWGRNYIKTIAALDSVRLARLASRNPESAQLVSAGCAISADWRQLIEAGDLDGIIIAAPPSLHGEMTGAAIAAGVPVLVEKPFTLGLTEAVALRDMAHARNALVMVDHTHLFHPAFEELKRQVTRLGTLNVIDAEAGNHGPYREDVTVLWDWGPHDVAMCLDLLRLSPREVRASRVAHQKVGNAEAETLRLELTFETGLRARIRISNMIDKTRRFAVHCEKGVLVYDALAQDQLVLYKDTPADTPPLQKGTPFSVSPEPPLQRVVQAFIAAIAMKEDRRLSLDLAVEVAAVLERCDKSLAAN